MTISHPWVALLLLITLAACSDLFGPAGARILNVTVESEGALVPALLIELDRPDQITVEYATPGAVPLMVRSSEPSTLHRVTLSRLRASSTYSYTVRTSEHAFGGQIETGPLPDDLADINFEATGVGTAPLILLEIPQLDGFSGFVIIDGTGEVVWYFRAVGAATGATRRANGNFVFVDLGVGLVEVTPEGTVVSTLLNTPDRNIHHDVLETSSGALRFLATEPRTIDGGTIVGDAIWEWVPESGVARRVWSSFDHLSPDIDWGTRSLTTDWLHANSLAVGPRGNLIVSLNFLNQVISLAPDLNTIEWRLGGPNATVMPPVAETFSGQHTAAEVSPGRVLMFDNGVERAEPFSRAVEFETAGGAATKVWEFRPERDNWARAVSSARRLSNGNTLVAFGLSEGVAGSTGPLEVYEVRNPGDVIWHLTLSGAIRVMYRASPIESVGSEAPVGNE